MSALTPYEILKRDRAFARSVKERAGGRCQRCGSSYGLHCAHVVGRSRWLARWYPDNGVALCWKCHRWAHDHPLESQEWFASLLGPERWQALCEMRRPARRRDVVEIERDGHSGREPDEPVTDSTGVMAGEPEVGQPTPVPAASNEAW